MYGRKVTPSQLRRARRCTCTCPARTAASSTSQALAGQQDVILCEALIDALTFWCAGYRNVTASYGVEGFTAEHLAAFKRHGTERVLIAYDRDDAGERAAADAGREADRAKASSAGACSFRKGMDANEYALQGARPPRRAWASLIRKAAWLGKGKPPTRRSRRRPRCAGATIAVRRGVARATSLPR